MILTIKIDNPKNEYAEIQTYDNIEFCKGSMEQMRDVKRVIYHLKHLSAIVIKTRSIYVAATLSNLMTAFCVAKEKPKCKKQIARVIPERLWIDPSNVTFYDGCRQLYLWDENTQGIDFDFLDSGARKINEEWDKLNNIKSIG